jgi:hypothetical protein
MDKQEKDPNNKIKGDHRIFLADVDMKNYQRPK